MKESLQKERKRNEAGISREAEMDDDEEMMMMMMMGKEASWFQTLMNSGWTYLFWVQW